MKVKAVAAGYTRENNIEKYINGGIISIPGHAYYWYYDENLELHAGSYDDRPEIEIVDFKGGEIQEVSEYGIKVIFKREN